MMAQAKCYEQYPLRIILLCNSLTIAIYLIGGFLILQLNFIFLLVYLLFILLLEARLMSRSCTGCYYYGSSCAFGRGRMSARLFERRDVEKLGRAEITWKAVLSDFMVSIIPIVAGIVLLVMSFDLVVLVLVILLVLLSTIGNGIIRGSFACKFCKQREIGCPAEKLFSKSRSKS